MKAKKTILFTCAKEAEYTRNEAIFKILNSEPDFKIIVATSKLKHYPTRILEIYGKIFSIRLRYKPDLIFAGFLSQPLIPFIKILFPKTPIIADGFISVYNALVLDRKLISENNFLAKIIFKTEKLIFKIPQKVLFDTKSHSDYIIRQFVLDNKKLDYLYLLASPKRFCGQSFSLPADQFKVFYYSIYLPVHGVDIIVEAAKILEAQFQNKIHFTIVGSGQEKNKIVALIRKYRLKNIKLLDWINYNYLPREIKKYHLCLAGHFSLGLKAQWVIPGKAYQFALMKKPMILSNYRANRELFTDMKNAIFCQGNDPKDLANKIIFAQKHKEVLKKIGESAYSIINREIKKSNAKLIKILNLELQ